MIPNFSRYRFLLVLTILFFVSGCSNYGRLKFQNKTESDALLQELSANSQQYTIHYHGNSEKIVSGILFDPKDDHKTIKPEGMLWKTTESPQTVADIIDSIRRGDFPGYFPSLYKIVGPEGIFFGYLYTGWSYLVVKPVDPDTVRVYGLRGPPEYESAVPGGL